MKKTSKFILILALIFSNLMITNAMEESPIEGAKVVENEQAEKSIVTNYVVTSLLYKTSYMIAGKAVEIYSTQGNEAMDQYLLNISNEIKFQYVFSIMINLFNRIDIIIRKLSDLDEISQRRSLKGKERGEPLALGQEECKATEFFSNFRFEDQVTILESLLFSFDKEDLMIIGQDRLNNLLKKLISRINEMPLLINIYNTICTYTKEFNCSHIGICPYNDEQLEQVSSGELPIKFEVEITEELIKLDANKEWLMPLMQELKGIIEDKLKESIETTIVQDYSQITENILEIDDAIKQKAVAFIDLFNKQNITYKEQQALIDIQNLTFVEKQKIAQYLISDFFIRIPIEPGAGYMLSVIYDLFHNRNSTFYRIPDYRILAEDALIFNQKEDFTSLRTSSQFKENYDISLSLFEQIYKLYPKSLQLIDISLDQNLHLTDFDSRLEMINIVTHNFIGNFSFRCYKLLQEIKIEDFHNEILGICTEFQDLLLLKKIFISTLNLIISHPIKYINKFLALEHFAYSLKKILNKIFYKESIENLVLDMKLFVENSDTSKFYKPDVINFLNSILEFDDVFLN